MQKGTLKWDCWTIKTKCVSRAFPFLSADILLYFGRLMSSFDVFGGHVEENTCLPGTPNMSGLCEWWRVVIDCREGLADLLVN